MDSVRIVLVMAIMGNALFMLYWFLKRILQSNLSVSQKSILLKIVLFYFLFPLPLLKNYYLDFCFFVNQKVYDMVQGVRLFADSQPVIYITSGFRTFQNAAYILMILILVVWGIGVIFNSMQAIHTYIPFKRNLYQNSYTTSNCNILAMLEHQKTELHIRKKVSIRISCSVSTPMTFGFFSPVIVLPFGTTADENLKYILKHELTHIRHNDYLLKMFCLIVTIIHWYNPLSYVLFKEVNAMCEYTCDKSVTMHLNKEQRKHYGIMILNMAAGQSDSPQTIAKMPISLFGYSDKEILFERMKIVKKNNTHSKLQLTVSFVAMVMAIVLSSFSVFAFTEHAVVENDPEGIYTDLEDTITILEREDAASVITEVETTEYLLNSDGQEVALNQITQRAPCNHSFKDVTYIRHTKYSDGTCTRKYYDAQECWKCNYVLVGEYQYSITASRCDH